MAENKTPSSRPAVRLSERAAAARDVRFRFVRARYDNAETTDENRRHWANASDLSADALASPWVRARLRSRCRYECRNNSWAKGIRDTLANDTVGTGPRLQMLTGNPELNERIERDFWPWADAVLLASKLRALRAARVESGEGFVLQRTNPGLGAVVKLDLSVLEPDHVTDPYLPAPGTDVLDGIEYDDYGNPTFYHVLKHHPGGVAGTPTVYVPTDFDRLPARYVYHYYRPDRPGQRRGVPDLTPAIDQFAELRRYSKAVIAAAEAVADHALVLYSDAPPDPDDATETVEAMDTVELTRRMATTLPQGWKLGQVEAEQPTTTYKEFVTAKLGEISRCLNVPLFVAALDTAGANMSATYVVGQKYERTIAVDRSELERLLDWILRAWLAEWSMATGTAVDPATANHAWQWDQIGEHADPGKVASARATNLASGVTNIPREYARQGLDWEDEQEAAAKSLGVSVAEYRRILLAKTFGAPAAAGGDPAAPDTETPDEDEPTDE